MDDKKAPQLWQKEWIDIFSKKAEMNNRIDPELYQRFDVKRGLRNADSTGVLVGLTEIGGVHGYVLSEKEKVPVDGQLFYRGIDLNNLVRGFQADGRFGFEEAAFLLLFGELPAKTDLEKFKQLLGENRALPEHFTEDMILKAPSSHVLNKLARSVLVCYSYDPDPENRSNPAILRQCIELIARIPTMVAYGYQAKRHYYDGESLYIHPPDPELGTAENLLQMIRSDRKFTPLEAEVLDLCLVIHAEHGGGNNSTFAIHVVSSTDTDIYSAVAAAVGSLKGPRHGGASVKVCEMMENIRRNVKDWDNKGKVADHLAKILDGKAFDRTGLIYGMGHAVYTLSDPRAVLLRERAMQLAKEKGREEDLQLYLMIEEIVPELFQRKKSSEKVIAPNVDFYSGFVYSMLNIPRDLFTPLFAVARIAGWCAHFIEERVSGGRIVRPAYKNVSEKQEYTSLAER